MAKKYDEILLLEYVEGDLDAPGVAKVQAWMRADARLESVIKQMIADRQALRRLPDPPAPSWIMDEVDQHLERQMLMGDTHAASDPHSRLRLRDWTVRLALAASLAVVTGWITWSLIPEKTWQPPEHVATAPINPTPTPPIVPPVPEQLPTHQESAPTPVLAQPPAKAPKPTQVATRPVEVIPLRWSVNMDRVLEPLRAAGQAVAKVEPPEPAPAQPPTTFARIEEPHEKLLFPGAASPKGAEVKSDKDLSELISLLARRPALAARCRLEILTRDVDKTRAALAELADGLDDPAKELRLRLTPAQLSGVLDSLREEPLHLSVKLFRPGEPSAPPPAEPDYTEILLDQLADAAAIKDRNPTIAIPVILRGP